MGNDQSTTDQEYQPTKLKILLERVRNVPMYTSADGNRKAEVFIELSLGGVAFTTHRVFASLTGEVILKKKFSLLHLDLL
ncbi:uncharacterized protein LOC129586884 [Paramacrobiotus metropolitanus]|uniref:uncharacterized protein LOC129586884 n=1 Tax=Paramacrobiotus metropolitanus TaxID=2943436 RepID=UPI002445EDD6|nr:uncharacterized protein LOC129586884 [Paramacrobiotus metropolitanus]